MKSSTAGDKSYIDVLKRKLPTEAPSDYSAGAFCLKLSPQWAGIVIGLVDHLLIKGVWENKTPEQWQQIQIWTEEVPSLLAICEEPEPCPECPEPEQPITPPITGGGSSPVGRLGLSLEELEEFIMGWSLRGQLKYVNGILCYWSDGCCDWVPVDSEGTPPPAVTSPTLGAIAEGLVGLTEWTNSGKPPLSGNSQPIPPVSDFYNTDDSLACVKATSIVLAIRQLLTDTSEGVLESAFWSTAVLGAIGGYLTFAGKSLAELWDLMTILWGASVGATATDRQNSIAEALDDFEGVWEDVICAAVDKMEPMVIFGGLKMNRITENDYLEVVTLIKSIVEPDGYVNKILDTYPLSSILAKARERLATTECGCEQYLPYGYDVPTPEGSLEYNFVQFAEGSTWGVNPTWLGLPYAGAFDGGSTGLLVSGRPKGIQNYTTPPAFESAFSAHYHLSSPAEIRQLKVAWSFPAGEAAVRLHIMCLPTGSEVWEYFDGAYSDEAAPFATTLTSNHAGIEITDFIVIVNTYYPHDGPQKPAHLTSILMSGEFLGNTFSELGIGEVYTP